MPQNKPFPEAPKTHCVCNSRDQMKVHKSVKFASGLKDTLKVFDNMPQPYELQRNHWNMKVGYKANEILPKHRKP